MIIYRLMLVQRKTFLPNLRTVNFRMRTKYYFAETVQLFGGRVCQNLQIITRCLSFNWFPQCQVSTYLHHVPNKYSIFSLCMDRKTFCQSDIGRISRHHWCIIWTSFEFSLNKFPTMLIQLNTNKYISSKFVHNRLAKNLAVQTFNVWIILKFW